MTQLHQARFVEEQGKKTILFGLVDSSVALLLIPYFYYLDLVELNLEGTLIWRAVGMAGALLFFISRLFKPNPKQVIVLHGISLSLYYAMMLGLAVMIFLDPRYGFEQQFAVTAGALMVSMIITLTAQGARLHLMRGILVLTTLYIAILLGEPPGNLGFPATIAAVGLFCAWILRMQYHQEREKSMYLYELEEKERRILQQHEELEEANTYLRGLNFAITHDLKGPLRRAQSFSQLVERRVKSGKEEELAEFFGHIRQNHGRILEILEGLTLLNQIGKSGITLEEVDLTKEAGKIWATLAVSKEAGRVEFHLGDLGKVQADPNLVWHIFENLFSNAIKYSQRKEQPVVEVGSQTEAGELVVHVKDNGAGFPQEFAKDLGRPFKRLHSAHDFEGTGIGLSVVRQIIEMHGGRFWAEGEEGEGACFYLAFPLTP